MSWLPIEVWTVRSSSSTGAVSSVVSKGGTWMLKIAASGCASRLAIASMCSRMRGSSNSRWVFHGVWFDQPVLSISCPGATSVDLALHQHDAVAAALADHVVDLVGIVVARAR